MGCNSHLYIEAKPFDWMDAWQTILCDVPESRRYRLYGLLADVRGEGPAVVPPRGKPSDLSHAVEEAFKSWGSDFHSPTWLYPSEFLKAINECGDVCFEWRMVAAILKMLAEEYGDDKVRIVIAFDN